MDMVDVEVHIVPKFGLPDFSLTGTQIGRRLRSAGFRGRPGDVFRNRIGMLVSDWAVQLESKLQMSTYEWEKHDYPSINKCILGQPGVFFPQPLDVPPQPQQPAPRRKVLFPPCQ